VLFDGPSDLDGAVTAKRQTKMNVAVAFGAVLVVVGFFLGWVGVDLGAATFSMSGWQIAKLARLYGVHYYLVYLFPLGAALTAMIALVDKRAGAKLGLVVGGGFLLWSLIELSRFLWRTTFIGLWLTVIGALVLLIGGFATKKSPSWD